MEDSSLCSAAVSCGISFSCKSPPFPGRPHTWCWWQGFLLPLDPAAAPCSCPAVLPWTWGEGAEGAFWYDLQGLWFDKEST